MNISVITALLTSTLRQGVPILFPAVGESVAERAGVMNIGLEGNMLIGAFATLMAYQFTSSLFLAILIGCLVGGLSAVIIAYVGVSGNRSQAVVGFMFNIFSAGLTSKNPAILYGAYPQKGCLQPGSDADIVLLRPGQKQLLTASMLHEKTDYTPFEGLELHMTVEKTIACGKVLMENGSDISVPGAGKRLYRKLPGDVK